MPARKPPPWSRKELAVLREFYPREGIDCADRLADRSWHAIHQKAHKLGLGCEKVSDAPATVLQGDSLEEAICLRERVGRGDLGIMSAVRRAHLDSTLIREGAYA